MANKPEKQRTVRPLECFWIMDVIHSLFFRLQLLYCNCFNWLVSHIICIYPLSASSSSSLFSNSSLTRLFTGELNFGPVTATNEGILLLAVVLVISAIIGNDSWSIETSIFHLKRNILLGVCVFMYEVFVISVQFIQKHLWNPQEDNCVETTQKFVVVFVFGWHISVCSICISTQIRDRLSQNNLLLLCVGCFENNCWVNRHLSSWLMWRKLK